MRAWQNGAVTKPADREPVLVTATDPKGDRFYCVMRYEADKNRWTSPMGIVIYWTEKQGTPEPWWIPVPPMPPMRLMEAQAELFKEGE